MSARFALVPVGLYALLSVVPAPARAATPAQKCAATKQKETGKKADRKLKCWSKGAKSGTAADPGCIAKAESTFSIKWDKAEAKGGCVTTNDKTGVEAKVDAFVDDVLTELTGVPPGTLLTDQDKRDCAAAKLRAAGKKASSKLKCEAKATSKGTAVDPLCLGKAETKFGGKWGKAEAQGGCATTNDQATIEAKVDAFVLDVTAELPAVPTTTTTVTTTTTTTVSTVTVTTTTTTTLSLCGNGMIDPGEQCDGTELGGAECDSTGGAYVGNTCGSPGGAFVACKPNCTLDCSCCIGGTCQTVCEPIVPNQAIPNTYQLVGIAGPKICHTGSSVNRFGPCNTDADCGGNSGTCLQTPWVTADGLGFQFPVGIVTQFTVAAEDSAPTCSHVACVKCGDPNAACAGIPGCGAPPAPPTSPCIRNTCCDDPGFTVPTFIIPLLGGLCGRVDQYACGLGVVNTSHPQTGDNEVNRAGDTSDPGADCTYGTLDDPPAKPCNTTPTGAGADTKAKVVRTQGNGSSDIDGVQIRLSTPEMATVWQDVQDCPDGAIFETGELLVAQLPLNAEPSTAGASGRFQDLNGDGCARAGSGFTTANQNGPITVGPPTAQPASYTGSDSMGVAVGPVFSGAGPLYDIGFVALTPNGPASVVANEACSCTPVAGCPE